MLQLRGKNSWGLGVVFDFLFFILFVVFSTGVSAVRINEVMPDPNDSCNDCTEWVEIYSETPTNLSNWTINSTNEKTNFSFYIEDFLIITRNKTAFKNLWRVNDSKLIEWKGMSLKNSGEGIFLFDNNLSLISEIGYPTIPTNRTYSLLPNLSWVVCAEPTPGSINLCQQNLIQNLTNQTQENQTSQNQTNQTGQNQTNNQTNQTQENQIQTPTKIYLELGYDGEVEKEFEAEVKAYNLNGIYDVKVYLEDGGKIISETYNEDGRKWQSSTYYLNNIFNVAGNKTESFKLRLDKDYKNFYGDAKIKVKIRKTGSSNIIAEFEDDIKLLKVEESSESLSNGLASNNKSNESEVIKEENRSIINLNPKDIKSPAEYKSRTQYIREYSIYGFALFCIIVIILLIKRKL